MKPKERSFKRIMTKAQFQSHTELVCEELDMMGFDAQMVLDGIQATGPFGGFTYKCSEPTVMGDVYRFCYHYASKLHKWGVAGKIKEFDEWRKRGKVSTKDLKKE